MDTWHAYIAGFFDGEGWANITRVRTKENSDYHKLMVGISQRAKHRAVFERIRAEFGGTIQIERRASEEHPRWADMAKWLLQKKADIERFLIAIRPFCLIKSPQIDIALEFVRTFEKAGPLRDSLGHIRGNILSAEQIEHRERLRLAMRDANAFGPERIKPTILPPLDIQGRQRRAEEWIGDPATISRGEHRPLAKLTDDDVRAIRAEYESGGVTKSALANRYGVSDMIIGGIVRRTRWKHVT